MTVNQDLSLLLLAGGRGSRLGRDKPAVPFPAPGDPPLIATVHRLLAPLAVGCLVAGPTSFGLPCRVVGDAPGIRGPLGGLVAGLLASDTELVLAAAADLPLVEPGLAQHMVERARERPAAMAVVCARGGRLEPLFAVYRRAAAGRLEEAAVDAPAHRGPSLRSCLYLLDPLVITEDGWRPFDPRGSSFQGCNTPEEMDAAARFAISRDSGGDP